MLSRRGAGGRPIEAWTGPGGASLIAMASIKLVVEKHADNYVAYPLGIKGVVVGQGPTYQAALDDVRSALQFHVESFGPDVLDTESPVIEAFVAEATLPVAV